MMIRLSTWFAIAVPLFASTPALADSGSSGIVGGAPTSGDPAVAAILALDDQQNLLGICSGTLIAPDVVLTAAHCVDAEVGASGYLIYFGTEVSDTDPGFEFATTAVSAVHHPDWDPAALTAGNDIAIIRLADDVPITPRRFNTTALGPADVGQPVRLVGWGKTGAADDSGVKRLVVSRLDEFDADFVLIGNPQTNICNGDSGGPAFMTIGGREVVVGVASFGDADCVEIGVSTRVDSYIDFIEREGDLAPSDPSDPNDPNDPGDDDDDEGGGGCSAGSPTSGASLALLAVLTVVTARRRRRA